MGALKPIIEDLRWQKATADSAVHKAKLQEQEEEKQEMLAEMTKVRDARNKVEAIEEAAKAAERAAKSAAEFERYLTVKRIRKGDQMNVPKMGDRVGVTYEVRERLSHSKP